MLTPLRLTPVQVERTKYLPPLLLELVEAAEIGGDLVPAVLTIVRKLGFDGFLYATASYHLRPNNDERIYYFTTLPRDWVVRYDQQAYVECESVAGACDERGARAEPFGLHTQAPEGLCPRATRATRTHN